MIKYVVIRTPRDMGWDKSQKFLSHHGMGLFSKIFRPMDNILVKYRLYKIKFRNISVSSVNTSEYHVISQSSPHWAVCKGQEQKIISVFF
jgi:hypothetical protein